MTPPHQAYHGVPKSSQIVDVRVRAALVGPNVSILSIFVCSYTHGIVYPG